MGPLNPTVAEAHDLLAQLGIATGGLDPVAVLERYCEANDLELGYFDAAGEKPVWIISDERGNVYAATEE